MWRAASAPCPTPACATAPKPSFLEWENNSVGNAIRPALVRLSDLSEEEAAQLLTDLQTMNLNDERPLWEILGLAIPPGTPWKQLRIGELKTLLALAAGDEDAIREGCDWIHHFKDMNPTRRLVYRCVESILNLGNADNYRRSLLLYGAESVRQAEALLDRSDRFFGLETLGADMQGSAMHQTLLAAYDKLFAADR
jgi:ribosomal protein S12 methylthiotransferase accessory factor